MAECWLKPNWRPVAAAMALPAVMLAACLAVAAVASSDAIRWGALAGAALTGLMLLGLSVLLRPRLARDGEQLLVRLRLGPPLRVPLDKVEVFFFGQGPAMTGPRGEEPDEDQQDQTSNVVVRLSESVPELHRRDVDKRLGHWCDGYIVIRGTHCEPLSAEVLGGLNRRLVQAHRELREGGKAPAAPKG